MNLLDAAKHILHLHLCEQEGLSSGQPTRTQWLEAVDNLSGAITAEEEMLQKSLSDRPDYNQKTFNRNI
jgi:hypothetical protein